MNRFSRLLLWAASTALLTDAGQAQPALAQQKSCLGCHAIDKKVVGPAFKEVAAKYAGQGDAVARLSAKVIKGGSGVWGVVPMPANSQVSEAEARQLVQWVLTIK